jgi:hypothetical protein
LLPYAVSPIILFPADYLQLWPVRR